MHKQRSYDEMISQLFQPTKHGKDRSIATITIQVTDACNLACTYCYQINKHTHVIPVEKGKKFIDDVLDGKYNNYIDYSKIEAIVLEFIGGEPFLAIDLVSEFTDYFIEGLIKRDHPWQNRFRISICSNGTLYFDPKVQEYLRKHKSHLSFSISIDGNKELHDSCRVFPDGSGSYEKAIAAVNHYRDYFNGYMGSKMTIAPGNINYITDAVKCFIENGYTDINLNCVYEEGWTVEHAKILYEQLKHVADYLLENDLYKDIYLSIFDRGFFRPKSPDDNQNWCWAGDTPVLTTKGYKPIKDIQVGDLVYTEDGSIQPVIDTMSHIANNIVRISASGIFDMICTDNHKLFAKPFDYLGNKGVKHFKEYGKYQVKELKNKDMLRMSTLPLNDNSIDFNKDLAYLVGRYIGDGWDYDNGNGHAICCSFEEKDELEQKFIQAKIDFNHNTNKTVEQYTITRKTENIFNKQLLEILHDCGHLASGKRIPNECLKWNKESLSALLAGYLDADGYFKDSEQKYCINTVSFELAQDIMLILRTIGYCPTCYHYKRHGHGKIMGRDVNLKDRYEIYFNKDLGRGRYVKNCDDKMWTTNLKYEYLNDEIEVFNITVANNHSYIAGGLVSSNCGGDGSMLSVDWRGDLYPCIRYMESSLGTSQKPLKIGNVDTGILSNQEECDINQCLKCVTRRSQSTDECFNCPIADGCSWCFPAGTKVSTPDGLVDIEELSAGDIVLDMNGQPQKIYQNLVREANDLVYVKATGLDDLLTTREHPFFCKPVDKRIRNLPVYGDPQWVKAGDLKTSDKIALFVPQLGDIDVDKDVAYVLGRYIGDGWKTPSGRKAHPYKYYICTSFDECEDFEEHLISGNIKFKKTMNRTVAEYNIHLTGNEELIQLMDSCGRYAKDKHVPAIVWNWNHESVEALLHGYFDADGSIDNDKDTVRFTSISKTLILNIAELVRAVYKKNVNITERHPSLTTQIEGRVVNQNISYEGRYLTRDPDRKYYEYDDELGVMWVNVASSTKDVPSSEIVYNLSVENNPTFIANGAIVHNCSAYNYQCFGTVHQRATYICIMHKARALANAYYWNKVYRISDPNKRFKIWIPEEWALEIIDEDEWKFLKWLESPAQI